MVDHLKEGLVCAVSAVGLDQQANLVEAAPMYDLALFHLKLALLSENDAARRAQITQKVEEYQKRNEVIRAQLPPASLSSSNPLNNSNNLSSSSSLSFPSAPSNNPASSFPLAPPNVAGRPLTPNYSTPAPNSTASFPPFPSQPPSFPPFPSQPPSSFSSQPSVSSFPSQPPSFSNFPQPVQPSQPPQTQIKPASDMNRAEAFQTAVELSDRGKHEDDARNYPTALPLYELAMDYYLQALKVEPNGDIKKGIRDRMKIYLDRAEQLKPVVAQMGGSAPINIIVSSAPRTPSNALPVYSSGGTCAACGGVILGSSLTALDRVWHPECFIGNVMCAGCLQPFALSNLIMKVKEGKPYHPMCFEGTTGLSKEEVRTFLGTSGQLVLRVDMPKKFFSPGEHLQFHFKIDNYTSYKINRVVAYLIKTETHMEISGTTFERKAKTSELKLGRSEFYQSSFPLGKGNFEGDFPFTIPPSIHASEVTGVDASFVREYELVAKCVLTRPLKDVKVAFQVKITSIGS